MSDAERGARLRAMQQALVARRVQPVDEWQPLLDKDKVVHELRKAIDDLRSERQINDDRSRAAARREDQFEQRYWASRADGLSAGIAAVRDALFHLVGEDY